MFRRLRAILAKRRHENDMQLELRAHLEQAESRLRARGLSEADARLAARREFGNVALIEEQGREARGTGWLDELRGDLHFALRYFSRHRLVTGIIVAVLALGIGVNTALFSVVQAFTMRPAPAVPVLDGLVYIRAEQRPQGVRPIPRELSMPEVEALATKSETFASVAAWTEDDVVMYRDANAPAKAIRIQFVTPNYFATLGVGVRGPGLPSFEESQPILDAVISDALWDDLFGRSPDALGRVLRVNDERVRVAGIAPPRFQGATPRANLQYLWMPLDARPRIVGGTRAFLASADSVRFMAFARLAPGVTAEDATPVAGLIASQAHAAMTKGPEPFSLESRIVPLRGAMATHPDDPLMVLTVVAIVPILILLVACTNVSSLMVAAAVARRQELAVRLSLGAPRSRLLRQLLTESALLALAGGAIGLLLFWWIVQLLSTRLTDVDLAPDLGTLAFTLVFAVGIGVLFGLSPALHATRVGPARALRDSGAGATQRSRLQRGFVAAQIAFTQPLLVLLAVMLFAIAGEGVQFPREEVASHVTRVRVRLPRDPRVEPARGQGPMSTLAQRLSEQQGVVAVVPEAQMFMFRYVRSHRADEGGGTRATGAMRVHVEGAAPGYFELLRVPIVRGRTILWSDTNAIVTPVVIGSDYARDLWGSGDPIGRRLVPAGREGMGESAEQGASETFTVVGVYDASVPTTRGSGTRIYTADGRNWRDDVLLVGTSRPAADLQPTIAAFIRAEAPDLPVLAVETLSQVGRAQRAEVSGLLAGLGAAGGLALSLASIGLYGVITLAVRQRRREIGIRLALGGRPLRVAGMFFGSGLMLSAIGLAIGLPVSMVAMTFVSPLLMAPNTATATTVGVGVASMVVVVASAASWFPARRAATVDPASVLRAE